MYNATLAKKIKITDSLYIYFVKPDSGVQNFISGQYVALGLFPESPRPECFPIEENPPKPEKLIKRTYSIGSSPEEKDSYEFFLAIVPTGTLTSRLVMLNEGDRIYCADKVVGKFTITEIPENRNLIMVSTGTGIAPFISMLRTGTTFTRDRKITLVYGARYKTDFAYLDELEKLKNKYPQFSYHTTLSREGLDWQGNRGYVQNFFVENKILVDPNKDNVLLCGNPGMVEEVEKIMLARGFVLHSNKVQGNLHLEKYW